MRFDTSVRLMLAWYQPWKRYVLSPQYQWFSVTSGIFVLVGQRWVIFDSYFAVKEYC